MRLITLFTLLFTLLTGGAEATRFDRILHIIGVDVYYDEVDEDILAYYSPADDHIVIGPKVDTLDERGQLRVILHELAHWSIGPYEGRVEFTLDSYLVLTDEYFAEIHAEMTTIVVSKHLYSGQLEHPLEELKDYLQTHPAFKSLTESESAMVMEQVKLSAKFLIKTLEKLDVNNELGVQ